MKNDQNYFALFNLPIKLPIDQTQLSIHYQQLQRKYHPDKFVSCSESEQNTMITQSAMINKAYQILKDPIESADYFLNLKGINFDAELTITHDHDFLIQQFELREQLDSIKNLKSRNEKKNALGEFSSQIEKRWREAYKQLLTRIDESNWSLALSYINKLRFLKKLQQDIDHLEDKLFEY